MEQIKTLFERVRNMERYQKWMTGLFIMLMLTQTGYMVKVSNGLSEIKTEVAVIKINMDNLDEKVREHINKMCDLPREH